MKQPYQIHKERAFQRFQAAAQKSQQEIQFALPLPEVVALIGRGLMHLAVLAFTKLAEQMMSWEVNELMREKKGAQRSSTFQRWGRQKGYCVMNGQKVPLQRPRVRDKRQREVPLGSYQSLERASLLDEAVWQKIMHGLSMRGYGEVVRELEQAYGIEKSSVSEHFFARAAGNVYKCWKHGPSKASNFVRCLSMEPTFRSSS